MQLNRLYISLITLILFSLIACSNEENALDKKDSHSDETASSIYTSLSSGGDSSGNKQPQYNDNFNVDSIDRPLQPQSNAAEPFQPLTTTQLSDFESTVVELTNAVRQKEGLPELQVDTPLSRIARLKSRDMLTNDYFSHASPTYGSPFTMMRDFGVTYRTAGENLAHGQRTPEQVVDAWMNSEGHRANILNSEFTHIGVGFVKSDYYWTQMFIEK